MYTILLLGSIHPRLPYAAYCCRLDPVQLEFFYPGILFIPDTRLTAEFDSVQRDINRTDLRLLAQIPFFIKGRIFVSKTYRHLRFGGVTSRSCVIGQQDNIPEAKTPHVFNCRIVKFYHAARLSAVYSFTK